MAAAVAEKARVVAVAARHLSLRLPFSVSGHRVASSAEAGGYPLTCIKSMPKERCDKLAGDRVRPLRLLSLSTCNPTKPFASFTRKDKFWAYDIALYSNCESTRGDSIRGSYVFPCIRVVCGFCVTFLHVPAVKIVKRSMTSIIGEELLDPTDEGDMDSQVKIESDDASNQSISDNENNNSCTWCLKSGAKAFSHSPSPGSPKTYCSELCFTLSRRASFKNTKVCDWCKHIRHTVSYVDFTDGDRQLQFCSQKCLNQYKMNIFCKETQEHLQQLQVQPGASTPATNNANSSSPLVSPSESDSQHAILITPDLWTNENKQRKDDELVEPTKKADSPVIEDVKPRIHANDAVEITPIRKRSSPGSSRHSVSRGHEARIVSPSQPREERQKHWHPHRASSERAKKDKFHEMASNAPMSQPTSSPRLSRDTPSSAATCNAGVTPAGLSDLGLSAQFSMFGPMNGQGNPLMYNPFMNAGIQPSGPPMANFNPFGLPPPNMNPEGNAAHPDSASRPDAFGHPHPLNPMARQLFPPCMPPHPGMPPLLSGGGLPPRMGPSAPSLLPPNTLLSPYPYLVPFPVPVPVPVPVPPTAYKKFMEKHNLPIPAEEEEKVEEEEEEEEEEDIVQRRNTSVPKEEEGREERSKSADVTHSRKTGNTFSHSHSSKKERPLRCPEMDSACNAGKIMCACCQNVGTSAEGPPGRPIKREASETRPHSSHSLPILVQPEHSISMNTVTPQCDGVIDLSSKKSRRNAPESDQEFSRNSSRRLRSPPTEANQHERVTLNLSSLQNPADNSYSSRRRMILDAPPTTKDRKRSPSPEKRLYYSLPSRELYGKRRCIRARIKSK
ncbi:hypothetical protein CAPTEDRAFT_226184 [Capitella teleta]|uniref:Uncharacterized protein n=1 Tax=Capitella teleta TaxID=283909 RepID=R7VAI6_CAPTE|nr:hypothetical protein CAPTEDRAFT_226184 [Capitella teleta]|eukprot:ELU12690.1 hypothetical protein CAPTEDRAFT_226184 [Capitella teleta]